MNYMPSNSDFSGVPQDNQTSDLSAEKSVIATCLVRPAAIAEAAHRIAPKDFGEPFHGRVFGLMIRLSEEGRTVSRETVLASIGDEELAPNLSVRKYLDELVKGAFVAQFVPFADAIEVVVDLAQRRDLSSIGWQIATGAPNLENDLSDIAGDAIYRLDDVLSALRPAKRRACDLAGAAQATLAYVDSDAQTTPTTGLEDLDKILGGWARGQLSIVAGRPGMGKSAVATGALLKAARANFGCAFFSLEMTMEQLGSRLLADIAYTQQAPIYYENILKRTLSERERHRLNKASEMLAGYPVTIEEQRGLTLAEIIARSRKVANQMARAGKHLDVIFVDHILLIRPSGRYAGNRVREVAEITDGLATLAKELDASVVGLCQLNRGVEGRDNKRPDLSDLRDSGSIEEDASAVVFMYRPAYYLEKQRHDDLAMESERLSLLEKNRSRLEFVVSKNRNGRVGIVNAFVDIGANAVRNLSYAS
jgi:replicative DNA helicase